MTHTGYMRVVSCLLVALVPLLCTGSDAAESGNLMVADFDGAKIETVTGLALPVLTDEQVGGPSSGTLSLIHPGAAGSKGALHVALRVEEGSPRPFAAVIAQVEKHGLAIDLSAYRGVRFYARAKAGSFNADVARFQGRAIRYTTTLTLKPEWTLVELPFEKFLGGAPGETPAPIVPKDVVSVGFSATPGERGQLDLEVDQLELYK